MRASNVSKLEFTGRRRQPALNSSDLPILSCNVRRPMIRRLVALGLVTGGVAALREWSFAQDRRKHPLPAPSD